MRALVVVFITSSLIANTSFVTTAPSPSSPFDQYGAIAAIVHGKRLLNIQ